MTWGVGDWCRYIYYGRIRKNADEASVGRGQIVVMGPLMVAVAEHALIYFVQLTDVYPDTAAGDTAACAEADRRNTQRGYPA